MATVEALRAEIQQTLTEAENKFEDFKKNAQAQLTALEKPHVDHKEKAETMDNFQNLDSMLFQCRNVLLPLLIAQKVSQNTKCARTR